MGEGLDVTAYEAGGDFDWSATFDGRMFDREYCFEFSNTTTNGSGVTPTCRTNRSPG